ncbi:MAG: hypothetical protein U0361_04695 [Nitrospiraceae bacterium]
MLFFATMAIIYSKQSESATRHSAKMIDRKRSQLRRAAAGAERRHRLEGEATAEGMSRQEVQVMVEIIGLGTIVTLVWLLAWAMGTEADSERLHGSHGSGVPCVQYRRRSRPRTARRVSVSVPEADR